VCTVIYGATATKLRRIREPLAIGFLLLCAGCIGMTTLQPDQGNRALGFQAIAGAGFAGPLILIIALCQLSTPKELIATGTAVLTSVRAVGATVATAWYAAALSGKLATLIPERVAGAAAAGGLPPSSIPSFVGALAGNKPDALAAVPGVTPSLVAAGVAAIKGALADGFRTVWIIAAPFAFVAVVGTLCLQNKSREMNYKVDAPIEDLHHHGHGRTEDVARLEKQ
jgi:hypothetical protein